MQCRALYSSDTIAPFKLLELIYCKYQLLSFYLFPVSLLDCNEFLIRFLKKIWYVLQILIWMSWHVSCFSFGMVLIIRVLLHQWSQMRALLCCILKVLRWFILTRCAQIYTEISLLKHLLKESDIFQYYAVFPIK